MRPEKSRLRDNLDKEWHKKVCERDKYICQKCLTNFNYPYYFDDKNINKYVCGHHIKSKKAHPELRHEVTNGTCVCQECHNLIHLGK